MSERCSFASGNVPEICRAEHLSDVAHAETVDNGEQVSGEDCAIPMAPWPAGAIAAITLPSSSAFYHRPFTETFQIQRGGGGGLERARWSQRGEEECFCCPGRWSPGLGDEKVLLMKSAAL